MMALEILAQLSWAEVSQSPHPLKISKINPKFDKNLLDQFLFGCR